MLIGFGISTFFRFLHFFMFSTEASIIVLPILQYVIYLLSFHIWMCPFYVCFFILLVLAVGLEAIEVFRSMC